MTVTAAPKHPGTITFEDLDGEKPTREEAYTNVPQTIAFADTKDGPAPVVRVVKSTTPDGKTRHIRQYGVDGTLLKTTVQAKRT